MVPRQLAEIDRNGKIGVIFAKVINWVSSIKNKSQMLKDMHPDLVELSDRFNRHHHFVDYSPFKKNKLIKKKNIHIKDGVNDYGIELVKI